MSIVSYAFFIMLGSIGFFSALAFVRHIYGVIKVRGVPEFEIIRPCPQIRID